MVEVGGARPPRRGELLVDDSIERTHVMAGGQQSSRQGAVSRTDIERSSGWLSADKFDRPVVNPSAQALVPASAAAS